MNKTGRYPNTQTHFTVITLICFFGISLGARVHAAYLPVQFSGNGHYYQYVDVSVPWTQARSLAEQNSGFLATISSQAENDFVAGLLPSGANAWLGGFQPSGSPEPAGGWQWVTGEPFNYMNWNTGEPNEGIGWNMSDENSLEIYGVISILGSWNDAPGTLYRAS